MIINNATDKNLATADVLNELKRKQCILEFRREATCLYCDELHQWIMPENFNVDELYYFEKTEMPDADRVLFAISLSQGTKGFLIDTCNVYMDNISQEMIEKLELSRIVSH